MVLTQTPKMSEAMKDLVNHIQSRHEDIYAWLESLEEGGAFPLYSSVDIRDSGFKAAVIDTNIYPAGFNNLCEHSLHDAIKFFRKAILKRVPDCENILIVSEEHTRNRWYLENVRILQEVITEAGFNVRIATFLKVQPSFCEKVKFVELETATGHSLRVYCFQNILKDFEAEKEKLQLIILNNDLINGIPDILKNSKVQIHPSLEAGWHSRFKSNHFNQTHELLKEFTKIIPVDIWLLSCLHTVVDNIHINDDSDQLKLYEAAGDLLNKIQEKYAQHQIKEKPYLVIKPDAGTYGMGIMIIEDVAHIKELNRKERNKLFKGKGSHEINRYIIQEGVQTTYQIDDKASEVCIYQVDNNFVGGFYRTNSVKGTRENLNNSGMEFHKICSEQDHRKDEDVYPEGEMFVLYRILARIAAIAASREIFQLEEESK